MTDVEKIRTWFDRYAYLGEDLCVDFDDGGDLVMLINGEIVDIADENGNLLSVEEAENLDWWGDKGE